MNIFLPSKLPIVILSSPRTGSTLLMNLFNQNFINHNLNVQVFNEPDYSREQKMNKEKMKVFDYHSSVSNNYLLKCHYYRLKLYDQDMITRLLDSGYKIRIRRRNIVNQIASLYVAVKRNKKFHYFDKTYNDISPVEIVESEIDRQINFILEVNMELDNAPVDFDLDLWYEDLEIPHNFTTQIVTPKPCNYEEICNIIQKRLSR
jgi:hypothetical protein